MSKLLLGLVLSISSLGAIPHSAFAEMADVRQSTSTKFDLIVRSKITIARPVEDVWPVFLDMNRWMANLRLLPVQGEHGKEGQVRQVFTSGAASPYGSYYITTVRVRPFEQYVLKVAPSSGTNYLGFADFSFMRAGRSTQITYDIYMELGVPKMTDREFRKFAKQQYDVAQREVEGNNLRLKRLVESGNSSPRRGD